MHFCALVVIPPEGDVEQAVTEAMAPYDEADESASIAFWDWWQIGGRWTGHLDGYDPRSDEALLEPCDLCRGTGMRTDEIGKAMRKKDPAFRCNACDGKGKRAKWPTDWPRRDGDTQPVEAVIKLLTEKPDKAPFTLIAPRVLMQSPLSFERTEEQTKDWHKRVVEELQQHPGQRVVVVDYHG